jgi:hypothetical protein
MNFAFAITAAKAKEDVFTMRFLVLSKGAHQLIPSAKGSE